MTEMETPKKKTPTDAQRRTNYKYKREKMTQFNLRFGNEIDADILEMLASVPNKRQYIIKLIRDDIARKSADENYMYYEIMYGNDDQEYGDGEENLKAAIERVKQLRAGEYPEAYIIVTENRNGNIVELAEIREIKCFDEKNTGGKTMKGYWYAVQRDSEDDWGTGSYDQAEAMEMLRKMREDHPDAQIAVIDEGDDPPHTAICVEEIRE